MLATDEVVDRFQVLELLGSGGIAQVYKARHRVLGSLHALKVVTAGGPSVARRLLREGSIQAQLRHPNVVAVTDVIEVRGHTALVLEFVEGITLQGLLAQRGVLPVDEALALFAQILAGVSAAHAAGVLHRDLKPANVLLAPGPSGVLAKVADFGLAKVVVEDGPAAGDTMQGLVMGTPGYMAPEQVGDAATADARADVFALGVILYEMLAGVSPFLADDIATTLRSTLSGRHRPLSELRPDAPPHVAAAVTRCLAVERADRLADAGALARALYGDRPDLAEVVEGHRAAVPLALALPTGMSMRAAGVAPTTPANPTLGPAAAESPLSVEVIDATASLYGASVAAGTTYLPGDPGPGASLDAALAPPEAAPPADHAHPAPTRPTRRWLLAGFGLFAAAATVALVVGRGAPPSDAPADAASAEGPPLAAAAPAGAPMVAPTADLAAPATLDGSPEGARTPTAGGALSSGGPDAPTGVAASGTAPSATAASGTAALAARPPGSAPPAEVALAGAPSPSAPIQGAPPQGAPSSAAATGAVPGSGASPTSAADAPPAAPAVAEAAPPAAPARGAAPAASGPGAAAFSGTWSGTWSGRPFTLAIATAGTDRLTGRLDVLVGQSFRSFALAGAVDAAGRFTLAEATSPGWFVEGALADPGLIGSIRHPDAKKATSFSARRK